MHYAEAGYKNCIMKSEIIRRSLSTKDSYKEPQFSLCVIKVNF